MRAETQSHIEKIRKSLTLLGQRMDLETAPHRLEEFNARVEDPDLWNDPEKAQKLMRDRQFLVDKMATYKAIETGLNDNVELIELGEMEDDQEVITEAESALAELTVTAAAKELEALLDGEAYQPQPVDDPPANAFEAQIHLSSYAIVYVERPSRVAEVDAWLGALLGIVAVSAVGLVLECAYFLRHGKGKDGQRYAIQLDHDEADVAVHTPTVGLPHDDADDADGAGDAGDADARLSTAISVAGSNGTGSSVEDESKDQSTQSQGSGQGVGTPLSDESHGGSPSDEGLDVA